MDADWSVELGADDAALEFPWSSPDGSQGYVELTSDIAAVSKIPEAEQFPALRSFLIRLNESSSPWITVKCDAWSDDEVGEAEEIYGGGVRMGSYVDVIRREERDRFSFEQHEHWVKGGVERLKRSPDDACRAELVVRRCYYHIDGNPEESTPGFNVTVYAFGYGDDAATAAAHWQGCLERVSEALTALAA